MAITMNDENDFKKLFNKQNKTEEEYQSLAQYVRNTNNSVALELCLNECTDAEVPAFFQEVAKLDVPLKIYDALYWRMIKSYSMDNSRVVGFNPPPSEKIKRTLKAISTFERPGSADPDALKADLEAGVYEQALLNAFKAKRKQRSDADALFEIRSDAEIAYYNSLIRAVIRSLIAKAQNQDPDALNRVKKAVMDEIENSEGLSEGCLEFFKAYLELGFEPPSAFDFFKKVENLSGEKFHTFDLLIQHKGNIHINYVEPLSTRVYLDFYDMDFARHQGESLLSYLISCKGKYDAQIFDILARNDVDVNLPDGKPLQYALRNKTDWLISKLIEKGATFPVDENADEYFVQAFNDNKLDFCDKIYQTGARLSEQKALEWLKKREVKNNKVLSESIIKYSNLDKDNPLLRSFFMKDYEEVITLLDRGATFPGGFTPNYFFDEVRKANRLDIYEKLYQKGIQLSPEFAREKALSAWNGHHLHLYEQIIKWGGLHSDSLFANTKEFKRAAVSFDQNILAKHYNNGSSVEDWQNQRAVVLLSDGTVRTIPSAYLFGQETALRLAKAHPDRLATCQEIANEEGNVVSPEMVGKLNVATMEKDLKPLKIRKVIYRPNHDIRHSMGAAALVPAIHQFKQSKYVNIEQLQLMLLASVCGREDETGFAQPGLRRNLYESYRAVAGLEFLHYVLRNWDNHYKNVFKNKEEVYQAALIVELMGYPELPNERDLAARNPPSILYRIMKGATLKEVKEIIAVYPNNNRLRGYTDEHLSTLLPKQAVEQVFNVASSDNLRYMNLTHADELLRCYPPDKMVNTITGDYEIISEALESAKNTRSAVTVLISHLKYVRDMLDAFGEKEASTFLKDQAQLGRVIETAQHIEQALNAVMGQPFDAVRANKISIRQNDKTLEYSLEDLISELGLDEQDLKLSGTGKMNKFARNKIIGNFLAKHALEAGNKNINERRFAFCHYHSPKALPQLHEAFDPANANYRDYVKDVETMIVVMDQIKRPEHVERTGYPLLLPNATQQDKENIKALCGTGVIISNENNRLFIEFDSVANAEQVLSLLYQFNVLAKIPETITLKIEITALEYNLIKPYLKFKQVKPVKEHSVEDNLIDEEGNLTVLSMIERHEAVAANHNACAATKNSDKTGVQWFFDQLENPSTDRPTRKNNAQQRNTLLLNYSHSGVAQQETLDRTEQAVAALDEQEPMTHNPPLTQYWRGYEQVSREVNIEQGEPKNTLFAKKSAFTLLERINQRLFQGAYDRANYFPVAFIFDIKKMHTHGERFVWVKNVGSNRKFWIKEGDLQPGDIVQAVTFSELQKHLASMDLTHKDKIENWNELLLSPQKVASCAIAVPGMAEIGDEAPLIYRINALNQAAWIRAQYGVDVPLLIHDGKHSTALYTETQMQADVLKLANDLASGRHLYLHQLPVESAYADYLKTLRSTVGVEINETRLRCEEQAILGDFFARLTGKKLEPPIEKYSYDAASAHIAAIDEKNTERLTSYIQSLDLTEENIKTYFKPLNYMGTQARERAYIQKKLAAISSGDTDTMKKLLIRCVALGHSQLIQELVQDKRFTLDVSSPLTPKEQTAMHIAVKNGDLESVKMLCALNGYPKVAISDGVSPAQSPLSLVEGLLMEEKNPDKLKELTAIKNVLCTKASVQEMMSKAFNIPPPSR